MISKDININYDQICATLDPTLKANVLQIQNNYEDLHGYVVLKRPTYKLQNISIGCNLDCDFQ